MTTPVALTLLGLGLGLLVLAGKSTPPAPEDRLRTRAIEAQRVAEIAARHARALTERWLEAQRRKA